MPRPQPPTQEVIAFQSSQRIVGSTVEEASGDAEQVALIKAVSQARQAVIYEFSALNDKWSGVSVTAGLTGAAIKLLEQSLLETVSVTGTFGLLSKTLVRDEQALAYELQALRDLWPDGLIPASLSGLGGTHAEGSILTHNNADSTWGVNSPVLVSDSGAISKAISLASDGALSINTGFVTGSLTINVADDLLASTTFGLIQLAAATTVVLTGSAGVTISSSGASNVTINPGSGGFILPDLLSGLLQTNGTGVVSKLSGTVNGALCVYDTGTSLWKENTSVTAVGGAVTATSFNAGGTAFDVNGITGNSGTTILIGSVAADTTIASGGALNLTSAAGSNITINPGTAGNLILSDLLSGLLQTGATGVTSVLQGSASNDLPLWNTGTSQWVAGPAPGAGFLPAGTVEDATLVWNNVSSAWEENTSILLTGGTIVGATSLGVTSSGGTLLLESFGGGINLLTSASQSVTINPGAGGSLILSDLSNGLLQVGATGIVSRLTGGTDNSVITWDAGTSQWGNDTTVTIASGVITATSLLAGGTSFDVNGITGNSGTNLLIGSVAANTTIASGGTLTLTSAAGSSIVINPGTAGSTQLPDLTASKVVQTDGSSNLTTGDVTRDQVEAELRTYTRIFYIEDPVATDSFPLMAVPYAHTVTRIHCQTDAGTVDFNLEKRGETTPFSAGTDIYSGPGDMQADSTSGTTITSFSSPGLSANQWIWYAASAVASSPTKLVIKITLTID